MQSTRGKVSSSEGFTGSLAITRGSYNMKGELKAIMAR